MQYDIHKLEIEQFAQEIQTVLEADEGWMSIQDIVEALDIEDQSDARQAVRFVLGWMFQRSMLQRTNYGWAESGGKYYKAV